MEGNSKSNPTSESQLDRYDNPDNDERGVWASLPAHAKAEKGRRQEQFFTIITPSGRRVDPPAGRCWLYTEDRFNEMVADKRISFGADGDNVPRVKKFLTEVREGLVPSTLWFHDEVGSNGHAKLELTTLFPGETPFSTPKPERLIQRMIHVGTNPNDLVLDIFLGSGTTTAVAQKMGRRWIGIEMGEHASTHCLPRLQKVLDGEQGGISKAVNWQGGGSFRFMKLGATIFDETGAIHPEVRFATLAAFVWMQETRTPWHKKKGLSPLLGTHEGVAYYLLFNGILGDRRPQGGNVLTRAVLDWLNKKFPHAGPRVIYGESVRVGPERLATEAVQFRSIPHDVEAR